MDCNKGIHSDSNPFLGLFDSSNDVTPNESTRDMNANNDTSITGVKYSDTSQTDRETLTPIVHKVFHLTVDSSPSSFGNLPLVFMSDIASRVRPYRTFDLETFESALFERLLLEDPTNHLVGSLTSVDSHAIQTECITYLFECYKRMESENVDQAFRERITSCIVQNASVALCQPILFEHQNVHLQVIKLFDTDDATGTILGSFLRDIVKKITTEEGKPVLKEAFYPILSDVHNNFKEANIVSFPRHHFVLLSSFATIPELAEIFVDYITPDRPHIPLSYSNTLLGSLLNISCLPKISEGQYEYFDQPDFTAMKAVEGNLWIGLEDLGERVHGVVESLLRGAQRGRVLKWLGSCLDANVPRGKLWASVSHPLLPVGVGFVSDGFAMNLASLLLRLCRPFIVPNKKSLDRLLKIDPTYPTSSDREGSGCQMKSLGSESCLQPTEEGEEKPCATKLPFSFLTEVFHMTHRALDLSVRVLLDRAQTLYQDMARLQQLPSDSMTSTLQLHMPKFLAMRCALLEPTMLSLLGQFEVATSIWVLQVLLDPDKNLQKESFAPLCERTLSFPLPMHGPATLRCVPEMIVESVEVWLRLTKQYSNQSLEQANLEPVLSLLLVLMSSKERARNPHLRARLAQSLEALLPSGPEQDQHQNPLGSYNRIALFNRHPHTQQIVESLLNVFVSIEMTGENVAFEQKFNYRRPMYVVMDYLWAIEPHRESFRRLARDAERKMEEVNPPLFLSFLNLLMNDAIFLLDEALSNMAQLRTMVAAREGGEWNNVSEEERRRNEQHFHHTGMIARFDNILGKETIHTLQYMSPEIKSLLCHATLVDRIAAMLNYFLYHLVGPKKKNFKVKDQDEYKFEPGTIVMDICRIYVSLGTYEEFCRAVSRDGRSYSPQLFKFACDVLARIGGGSLVVEVEEIAKKIEGSFSQLETEEELLADCPDEFLDPIMSTVMSDPVLLPSSKITIDRATIARHLLSDQTDPFNRAPLTMNMVEPNLELKQKIESWIAERKHLKDDKPPS